MILKKMLIKKKIEKKNQYKKKNKKRIKRNTIKERNIIEYNGRLDVWWAARRPEGPPCAPMDVRASLATSQTRTTNLINLCSLVRANLESVKYILLRGYIYFRHREFLRKRLQRFGSNLAQMYLGAIQKCLFLEFLIRGLEKNLRKF